MTVPAQFRAATPMLIDFEHKQTRSRSRGLQIQRSSQGLYLIRLKIQLCINKPFVSETTKEELNPRWR